MLLQKGLVELQHGDLKAAREDLQSASKLDPKNAFVWSALAEVYARTREFPQAANAAAEAEKTGAGNPLVSHALALYYSHVGDFAKAARFEERFATSPKADVNAKPRAAQWYLEAGNADRALPLAQDAAAADPQTGFALAQTLLRQQQFTEAASVLEAGLRTHPDDAQLVLALGVARYGQRRFNDAILAFLHVVQLDSQIPQPYLFLGRMLDQAGPHLDEIAKDAEQWAQDNPTDAGSQLLLAKVLLTRDEKDPRIESLLRRSVELDDKNWEAHYQLGLLLEAQHQYAPAAEELEKAIHLDAKQAMPHYHLARVYDRLGNRQRAAEERALHQQLTVAPAQH